MATKKIEGRIEMMEEQIVGVHGEMASVKGELQRLGPIEIKVDSMMGKLTVLERMEQLLLKWENRKKIQTHKGRRANHQNQGTLIFTW